MLRFIKNKAINAKSRNLVLNLLEPVMGKNYDYCCGAANQQNFTIVNSDINVVYFKRTDIICDIILQLKFDDNQNCSFYTAYFVEPGQNLLNALFVDTYMVRDAGLI